MATFNALTLTNQGIALRTKAEAGSVLHFTTCQIGDGELQTGQSIVNLTDMVHRMNTCKVHSNISVSNGMASFQLTFTVYQLDSQKTGFYIREFGVFAKDPDIGEILYAWASAAGTPDFAPFEDRGHDWTFNVKVPVGTVPVENIRGYYLPYSYHSGSFNP